jgi:pimeloyl-ACP methyl ester carboxylesterase
MRGDAFRDMAAAVRSLLPLVGLLLLGYSFSVHAQDQFLDVDGITLRYVDRGQGTPVVLVHGFSASVETNWDRHGVTTALLDAGFRVIAYDNRGHGKSAKPYDPDKYGMEMVNDIRRVFDHLGLEQAHIVGYSMGARLTNKFRAVHPERVLSVVLGGYGWGRATTTTTKEQIEELLAARTVVEPNDVNALLATRPRILDYEVNEQDLRENEIPVLALIGDDDPRRPFAEAMSDLMPGLEVRIVPGTHFSALSNSMFVEELVSFLESSDYL